MRHTLEQLRAMSDEELHQAWTDAQFPFDFLGEIGQQCGCLTQHTWEGRCNEANHTTLRHEVVSIFGETFTPTPRQIPKLREHLEEVYALRLFYDRFYPRNVEPAEPAQADQLEAMRISDLELSTGER